ncbi:hypothetical protein BGZ99_010172 [Dissophora globulifera]|uniref:Uncharacterized protein n=1 Tax=Dissophora globulifera TaxID=979702 RepID=A0A9P6R2N7_9FUNG|nr:hypothetical protein BGZ99_010172 [Dissophora globulifera]
MKSAILFHHTPKYDATLKGEFGSELCELIIYAGGGFRWTKIDVSIQIGTTLFKKTVNLGTKFTFQLVLNEKFEDAITYINVQFGDYTFKKATHFIGTGPSEYQQLLKERMERNTHLKTEFAISTGECCLIL